MADTYGPPKRQPGAGPDFTGLGGYGPWPDNDPPQSDEDPSPHYRDGWQNRAPGSCHVEAPTDYWLDCLTYPERPTAVSDEQGDALERGAWFFHITVGNLTGKKPGPVN